MAESCQVQSLNRPKKVLEIDLSQCSKSGRSLEFYFNDKARKINLFNVQSCPRRFKKCGYEILMYSGKDILI